MIPIGRYEFEKAVAELREELNRVKERLETLIALLKENGKGVGHSREDSQKRKVAD